MVSIYDMYQYDPTCLPWVCGVVSLGVGFFIVVYHTCLPRVCGVVYSLFCVFFLIFVGRVSHSLLSIESGGLPTGSALLGAQLYVNGAHL